MRNKILGYGVDVPVVYVLGNDIEIEHIDDIDIKIVGLNNPFRILIIQSDGDVKRRNKYRPLVSGISIGHMNITAGTLGWFGKIKDKNVLISNAHVFHPDPCSDKPPLMYNIIQPGRYDGGIFLTDTVAYYHSHVSLNRQSNCPVAKTIIWLLNKISEGLGRKTRFETRVDEAIDVDIALATVNNNIEYIYRVLTDIEGIINPIDKGWKLAGFLFAGTDDRFVFAKAKNILKYYPDLDFGVPIAEEIIEGMKVIKCGRTTGCTKGVIETANAYVKVMGYPCGEILFGDVAVVIGKSAGGDSGSAVWIIDE